MIKHEREVMQMIAKAGDARTTYLQAFRQAREGEWREVAFLVEKADQYLMKAHQIQTDLIQREIRGEPVDLTFFMIHAQDHLMNALTVKDIAIEMIEDYRRKTLAPEG